MTRPSRWRIQAAPGAGPSGGGSCLVPTRARNSATLHPANTIGPLDLATANRLHWACHSAGLPAVICGRLMESAVTVSVWSAGTGRVRMLGTLGCVAAVEIRAATAAAEGATR